MWRINTSRRHNTHTSPLPPHTHRHTPCILMHSPLCCILGSCYGSNPGDYLVHNTFLSLLSLVWIVARLAYISDAHVTPWILSSLQSTKKNPWSVLETLCRTLSISCRSLLSIWCASYSTTPSHVISSTWWRHAVYT